MLKFKLESLDGLTDEIKALYEEKDGVFYLKQIDGMPPSEDVSGLKAKVQELLDEKKAESEKVRTAEEEARKAKEEKARKEGDFQSLAESYEQKIQTLEGKVQNLEQEKTDILKQGEQREVERQATLMAAELSRGHNQELLASFIGQRLRVEDGEIKVTDEKGNLTISTVDQLKEEFRTNPKFGALVIASEANGGGATNNQGTGGAGDKKLSEMTEKERVELHRENPEEFKRLKSAESTI